MNYISIIPDDIILYHIMDIKNIHSLIMYSLASKSNNNIVKKYLSYLKFININDINILKEFILKGNRSIKLESFIKNRKYISYHYIVNIKINCKYNYHLTDDPADLANQQLNQMHFIQIITQDGKIFSVHNLNNKIANILVTPSQISYVYDIPNITANALLSVIVDNINNNVKSKPINFSIRYY